MNEVLTPQETAAYLRLSPKTLAKLRWAGRGPGFLKFGSAVRYRRQDLEAYIEAARRASTSDPGQPVQKGGPVR